MNLGCLFHPAGEVVEDATSRTYEVVVPYGTSLSLFIRTYGIELEDEQGRQAVSAVDTEIPFQVAAGATKPAPYQFKVRSVLP